MASPMIERTSLSDLFELEVTLPDDRIAQIANRLVGFDARYDRLHRDLRMLVDTNGLDAWSRKHHRAVLPIVRAVADRYPLVIFHGDVGTGKTATAEAIANRLATDLGVEAMLFKLSTQVRGSGHVGQMSTLINQAFEVIGEQAGKRRHSFLILDEADSLAASRESDHSHHEDKVAVNTLIQKIDDTRRFAGRVLVFLCTNRFDALDPAIMRRAGRIEQFNRPTAAERRQLFELDCKGLAVTQTELQQLVDLTGPQPDKGREFGLTFSDIRTRLLPDALSRAYPTRALAAQDLIDAARSIMPTTPLVVGA